MILERDRPCPVKGLVLDTLIFWGRGNVDLRALISEASPIDVEGAWAFT